MLILSNGNRCYSKREYNDVNHDKCQQQSTKFSPLKVNDGKRRSLKWIMFKMTQRKSSNRKSGTKRFERISSGNCDPIKVFELSINEENSEYKQYDLMEIQSFTISNELLNEIHHQAAQVVDQLYDSVKIEQMSQVICKFYQKLNENLTVNSFSNLTDNVVNQLIRYIETRLLGPMYNSIHDQIVNENEQQDLSLETHISSLNRIKLIDLQLKVDLDNPEIGDLLEKSISHLIEMGSKKSPLQKLDSIVNCSKTIIRMLQIDSTNHISADELLPALIYVIIKANPATIKSDIKFIEQFSYSNHLMSGESGYYFTNLCCALIFIENLDGQSLNLPGKKFLPNN